jgi:hypothetical protein
MCSKRAQRYLDLSESLRVYHQVLDRCVSLAICNWLEAQRATFDVVVCQ